MSISRRLLLVGTALGLFLGLASVARAQEQARPFFPYPIQTKKLANGLTVIVVQMPGSGLASVRTAVRTGSRDEYEPGRTGFAHFFEHMMFRGTKKMPQEERERVVTQMGAATNAGTTTPDSRPRKTSGRFSNACNRRWLVEHASIQPGYPQRLRTNRVALTTSASVSKAT